MLIGLHGKKRSGKDQSYQFIAEWAAEQGRPVRRDAFADRLKISAARALGYVGSDEHCISMCNNLKEDGWEVVVREPEGLEHFISGRQYLQFYGTEAHREVFDPGFWIDRVLDHYSSPEILVITDVRFADEAEAIHAAGGEIWHVLRVRDVAMDDPHVSERPLPSDLIDHLIFNNSSLDHLRDLVLSRAERSLMSERTLRGPHR